MDRSLQQLEIPKHDQYVIMLQQQLILSAFTVRYLLDHRRQLCLTDNASDEEWWICQTQVL